ncbi:MAG: PocR ligand-binding domain-containing protein [Candidatus Omnitrophica bacterium]|nr:PocR ligand-binding domain-containing protein [Candidatus Omnitrophota bacterium]
MTDDKSRKLAQQLIIKNKWWDMLSRFIDVLRINIYIVDRAGQIILPPEETKYGGRLLTHPALGFDIFKEDDAFEIQFVNHAHYLEATNRYDLFSYAIPIKTADSEVIAYVMVGPVILNKRRDTVDYVNQAKLIGADVEGVLNEIKEIRVVSNIMLNSIINLLTEIVRDNIKIHSNHENSANDHTISQKIWTKKFEIMANEIYSTVRVDELLITLLDVALKMTDTECGSVMMLDQETNELTIKASKGLKNRKTEDIRLKMGEGIAGLVAKSKAPLIIDRDNPDSRIASMLHRPEIKKALVMPLVSRNRCYGVLNLHTNNADDKLTENLDNLQYLTQLLSSAF